MRNKLCVQVWTPDHNQNQLFLYSHHHLFPHNFLLSPNHIPNSKFRIWDSKQYFGAIAYAQNPNLNVHADVSSEARYLKSRYLKFGLILHLHPYFVYVKSKGSAARLPGCAGYCC